jgi:catechol 2,3-dioxygenase-like lactoylglutathione lyase family enzyme
MGFAVADLERSIAFYTGLLGEGPYFDEVYDVEYLGRLVGHPGAVQHAAFFRLPGQPDLFLELIQYLKPVPGVVDMNAYNAGNAHICLACDDLVAAHDLVVSLGGDVRSQGIVETDYGVYEGTRAFFFRDPDGITVQIVELPPGVDPAGRRVEPGQS